MEDINKIMKRMRKADLRSEYLKEEEARNRLKSMGGAKYGV